MALPRLVRRSRLELEGRPLPRSAFLDRLRRRRGTPRVHDGSAVSRYRAVHGAPAAPQPRSITAKSTAQPSRNTPQPPGISRHGREGFPILTADQLQNDGVSPAGGRPEQFREAIRKEIEVWRKVVSKAGVRAE